MKTLGMMHPTDIPTFGSTDAIGTMVAVAGTAQAFDTPSGAGYVSFSANSIDFYVAFGSTNASVPTVSSTPGTTANRSIPNPDVRNIGSTLTCTGISIVSPSTGIIVMEWFHV
jgi:hypothetical protein